MDSDTRIQLYGFNCVDSAAWIQPHGFSTGKERRTGPAAGEGVVGMKIFRMILVGFLLYIILMLIEVLATIPFGMPAEGGEGTMLVWEFLIMAIPAGLASFLAARMLRLGSRREALLHAAVWTAMYAGALLLIAALPAFGNNNSGVLFGTPTLYVLLACYFAGPLAYAWTKHLA